MCCQAKAGFTEVNDMVGDRMNRKRGGELRWPMRRSLGKV